MNLIKDKIPVLGLDIVERRSSYCLDSIYIICEAYPRTPYGHLIPRRNLTGQEIKSLIEKFGVNNQGLAVKNKKTKAVVTLFVSNCNSKSDRLALIISHILVSFFY